ncbi:syncytin-1-like [Pseudophryne corroboree]|uniref:syncytin-1-like n=1 Tax=Pseudophryne corroboree TaxID=495146 RepID=UPI0030814494
MSLKHWTDCMTGNQERNILVNSLTKQIIYTLWDEPYTLPSGIYYICGRRAYKWLSYNAFGICFIGTLIPDVVTLDHEDMKEQFTSKVTPPGQRLTKREVKTISKKYKHLFTLSTGYKLGLGFGNIITFGTWGSTANQKMILALGDIIDNITEIYDSTFRYIGHELQAVRTELIQHRMILDYFIAVSAGYCVTLQTVYGVKCCTYITNDTNPEDIIDEKMNEVIQLKNQFAITHNYTSVIPDSYFSWLSWLNPNNWFHGIGGWIAGILSIIAKMLALLLVIYIVVNIIMWIIQKILTQRSFSVRGVSETGKSQPIYLELLGDTTIYNSTLFYCDTCHTRYTEASSCPYCYDDVI